MDPWRPQGHVFCLFVFIKFSNLHVGQICLSAILLTPWWLVAVSIIRPTLLHPSMLANHRWFLSHWCSSVHVWFLIDCYWLTAESWLWLGQTGVWAGTRQGSSQSRTGLWRTLADIIIQGVRAGRVVISRQFILAGGSERKWKCV